MVQAALREMPPDRQCYRLVNGILVPSQAAATIEDLKGDVKNSLQLIENFNGQHANLGKQTAMLCQKYNLIKNADSGAV